MPNSLPHRFGHSQLQANVSVLRIVPGTTLGDSNRQNAPSQQPPSLLRQKMDPSSSDCSYSIPVNVTAKCLAFRLDGSGYSEYRHIFQKRSYAELGTKPLVDVLKKVFKAESKNRATTNASLSSANAPTKDAMIYCDLLPDYLRKANERKSISVLLPEIVLEEKGKHNRFKVCES